MKQVQITIPNEPRERIQSIISILNTDFSIHNMVALRGENNTLIIFRSPTKVIGRVINNLTKIGIGVSYGIIDILNISATIPESAACCITAEDEQISSRISVEEMKNLIYSSSNPDVHYIIFIILAAITAGAGLLLNSVAIIIGSMIISPMMGPIIGFSFGLVIQDKNLIKNGLKGQGIGIVLGVSMGFLLGLVYHLTLPTSPITAEMARRNYPGLLDVIIAVCAGIAVGFCMTGTLESSLVGIAIAVSLMPPTVNIGLALAFEEFSLAGGSAVLLIVNILAINICATFIFKLKKIRQTLAPFEFWEGPQENIIHPKNIVPEL
jgi:uncharacterized hydrophobic protein (TIGR00271 family)